VLRHYLQAGVIGLALGLLSGPSPATAQTAVTLRPDELRGLAQQALAAGRPSETRQLADALLLRDPADVVALVLLAEAAILGGDFPAALDAATRAYRVAPLDDRRFAAARLAALAHSQMGQDTRAQIWLRRARQLAPDSRAVRSIADDYGYLRGRNPWGTTLSLGIAPSSNINGGSTATTTQLPYDTNPALIDILDFLGIYDPLTGEVLVGDNQRAISGLQISAGAKVSYRLAADASRATFIDADLRGRSFVLSDEARALRPDARGRDFADLNLNFGLTHRFIVAGQSDPWSVGASIGQSWFGGDAYSRSLQVSGGRGWAIDARSRLDLSTQALLQNRLADDDTAWIVAGRAIFGHQIGRGDHVALSLGLRENRSDLPDVGYRSLSLGARYDLGAPVGGLQFGFGVEAENRDYATSRYDPDGRGDLRTSARVTVGVPQVDYYGFQPVISLEATRNASDVGLFDSRDVRLDLGFRSSF
jgi:tetratricopeptide (TPR) repeat protein